MFLTWGYIFSPLSPPWMRCLLVSQPCDLCLTRERSRLWGRLFSEAALRQLSGRLPLCPGGLLLCATTTVVGSGSLLVSRDLSHGGQPHPTGARLQRKSYLVFVVFSTGVECAAVHCTVHLQLAWAFVGLKISMVCGFPEVYALNLVLTKNLLKPWWCLWKSCKTI